MLNNFTKSCRQIWWCINQFFYAISPLTYTQIHTLSKRRYILWVVALLEVCDVTNNGRLLGRHPGFYQKLEARLKPREVVIFLYFSWKIRHKWALCMILATIFPFIGGKSWENMDFRSKTAWTPATYDVISSSHSKRPPLNLSQNVGGGWTNNYWC